MVDRELYAVILGVSSGFGRACAIELARIGYNIYGVHLDTGTNKEKAEEFRRSLEHLNIRAKFFNLNAADDNKRQEVIDAIRKDKESNPNHVLRVLIHSFIGHKTYSKQSCWLKILVFLH